MKATINPAAMAGMYYAATKIPAGMPIAQPVYEYRTRNGVLVWSDKTEELIGSKVARVCNETTWKLERSI